MNVADPRWPTVHGCVLPDPLRRWRHCALTAVVSLTLVTLTVPARFRVITRRGGAVGVLAPVRAAPTCVQVMASPDAFVVGGVRRTRHIRRLVAKVYHLIGISVVTHRATSHSRRSSLLTPGAPTCQRNWKGSSRESCRCAHTAWGGRRDCGLFFHGNSSRE